MKDLPERCNEVSLEKTERTKEETENFLKRLQFYQIKTSLPINAK